MDRHGEAPEDHEWITRENGEGKRICYCSICGDRPCPVHEPFLYSRWREDLKERA